MSGSISNTTAMDRSDRISWPAMHMRFRKICSAMALAVFLIGCSQRDYFDGYREHSGDLKAFLMDHASSLGWPAEQTNNLPNLPDHWSYNTNTAGFDVALECNYFDSFGAFIEAAYGTPEKRPRTNHVSGMTVVTRVYDSGIRAILSYYKEADGREITSLVIAPPREE